MDIMANIKMVVMMRLAFSVLTLLVGLVAALLALLDNKKDEAIMRAPVAIVGIYMTIKTIKELGLLKELGMLG